jgi:hypothetical protein
VLLDVNNGTTAEPLKINRLRALVMNVEMAEIPVGMIVSLQLDLILTPF